MEYRHRFRSSLVACLLLAPLGCSVLAEGPGDGITQPLTAPNAGRFASAKSREAWWKEKKRQAEFVPGKGYAVEGMEGFFDDEGRPIGEPVVQSSPARSEPDVNLAQREHGEVDASSKNAFTRLRETLGPSPDEQIARKAFAEAETFFRDKQYGKAANEYRRAARRWPDSPLEEDAMFMAAESHFFANNYPNANDAYDALLEKYPSSRRLDDVIRRQFSIARYWHQFHDAEPHWPITPNVVDNTRHGFDTLGHALRTYDNIRLNDPTGPVADDALMATATAHFTRGRFDDADYHFELLRREYPKSEHQFQAHLLGLQCKLRKYQGPEYDGTALVEAEKLAKQTITQFPDKLGEERERVQQIQAEIAAQRALRDWRMGEYYAKGKHYGAARSYYERIVRDHPKTKLGEQATSRLAEFQGEPDRPSQWWDNLFQDGEQEALIATQPDGSAVQR